MKIWLVEEFEISDSCRLNEYWIFADFKKAKYFFEKVSLKKLSAKVFDEDNPSYSVIIGDTEYSITETETDD